MIKVINIKKPGDGSAFEIIERKEKDPVGNELVVDVHFSGINFADIVMRQGLYPDAPPYPFSPGYEISGVVTKLGPEVTKFKVGDRVLAGCHFGGYASEVVLPEWQVKNLPDDWSFEEGAGLTVSFLTAYLTLFDEGRVRSGDKVLIDCATGALGTLCTKMLIPNGVEVHGLTSSAAKKELLEKRGVKAFTHDEFYNDSNLKGYDFILNSQGGTSIKKHYERLGLTGRIVCIGASSAVKQGKRSLLKALKLVLSMPKFNPINLMNDNRGIYGLNALRFFENPEFLSSRMDKFTEFDAKPAIDKAFPYGQVSDAHSYIEQKKSRGKVLLSWK
ncbi:MAG: alcohol dehydrogenase catalytic domain-containing protein [Bacteriovoracaceae bacterium]|nr:alcohol dehydrogenase catalytic domain-containing protein [Bacteriovoracaceae bacterium]